jgi:hypothetical protein
MFWKIPKKSNNKLVKKVIQRVNGEHFKSFYDQCLAENIDLEIIVEESSSKKQVK